MKYMINWTIRKFFVENFGWVIINIRDWNWVIHFLE